jgi:hypothetical protein
VQRSLSALSASTIALSSSPTTHTSLRLMKKEGAHRPGAAAVEFQKI